MDYAVTCSPSDGTSNVDEDVDVVDYAFSRKPHDVVEVGSTHQPGTTEAEKADFFDFIVATLAVLTYIADVVTDILSAQQYFIKEQWTWFIPTVLLIIFPSIIMQIFSSKWYTDDHSAENFKDTKPQSCFSRIIHILQLGAVERYVMAFWYGAKTWCLSKPKKNDFLKYLSSWRDVTFLRLIECYVESAPQIVLQLYILSTYGRRITVKQDYIIISQICFSIGSIAWSNVSFTHCLRLCYKRKGLGICGYTFQVIYRLSMISSRIAALVLFTTEYGWIVVPITCVHWLIMVIWISFDDGDFCVHPHRWTKKILETLFGAVLGVIYIFCFMNVKEGATRHRVMFYYLIFFIENSALVAAWYPTRKQIGILEIGAIVFTWGGFLIGIISMLVYYKLFHPNQDITEGWCSCCSRDVQNDEDEVPTQGELEMSRTSQSLENLSTHRKKSPRFNRALSVDVELFRRPSPQPTRHNFKNGTKFEGNGHVTETRLRPENVVNSKLETRKTSDNENTSLVNNSYGKDSILYTVSVKPSPKPSTKPFDTSGAVIQFYV